MKTTWVKYRHKWASHIDKKWKYIEIENDIIEEYEKDDNPESALGECLSNEYDIGEDYSWSDKYRGFQYEKCEGLPPIEELKKRYNTALSRIKIYESEAERFKKLLDQAGYISKEEMEI